MGGLDLDCERHVGGALLAKSGNVVTRNVAGETIIVPVSNGVGNLEAIFTLNEVGGAIWQLLDGRTATEAVAAVIAREYDVDEAEARQDVSEFLGILKSKGLVVAAGSVP